MISSAFISFIVQPFYNALIFLVDFLTTDLGLAIIVLTILFRIIIFPLSKSQIKTQIKMKEIQGPMRDLKKKYKNDQQEMAREMMKLYRENNIKPFSGFLLLLVQLPLLIGFYYIFIKTGLPEINTDLIYSFIPQPETIDTMFLGIDLTSKSVLLAVLASLTQYIQAKLLFSGNKDDKNQPEKGSMEDVMNGVQKQMMFIMPIVLLFISYAFGAIVALYLLTSNLFSIAQEMYLKKTLKKQKQEPTKQTPPGPTPTSAQLTK